MQVTVSLLVLYTFTLAVAAVGVPVEFTLADGTVSSNHTLESNDFEVISDMVGTITTKEEIESSGSQIPITLNVIEDEKMLRQLKRFWCEEVPADMEDIGPDQFSRFIQASNYLLMHGDTSMRFGRNMARAALLGRHASAIGKKFPYPNPLDGWNITWQMFIGFAAQIGCEVRVSNVGGEVTLYFADDPVAKIYGIPASEFEKRPVIRKLSLKCDIPRNVATPGRMGILTWFLCHLGVPSLSIGSEFILTPGDIHRFCQAISYINDLESRGEIEKALIMERLDLSKHLLSFEPIRSLITELPSLKELQINAGSLTPSAGHAFKGCNKLEKLVISEVSQDTLFIGALVHNIPSIKELVLIDVGSLGPSAGHAFKGCDKLEKLVVGGDCQDTSFVEALIPNLPSIKELDIKAESLNPSAADAFKGCDKLEKLVVGGNRQGTSFVSALIHNLPSIKELVLSNVGSLNPLAGHAFTGCDKLEKLVVGGNRQGTSFVSALIPNLPSIKQLKIDVEKLTPEAADAFKGCDKLEKLVVGGNRQDTSFISALIPNLPSIKELNIKAGSLSPSAGHAFTGCDKLEKLVVGGDCQDTSFVEALIPNLPSIKDLNIRVKSLTPEAADAFKRCDKLEKLYIPGDSQDTSFVEALLPNLPSIKELNIKVVSLNPSAADAFKGCDKLEKLVVGGNRQGTSFVSALIHNLPSIKELVLSNVGSLNPLAGHAFTGCDKLEKLVVGGNRQGTSFVSALIPNLPSIKQLKIDVEKLTPLAGHAFTGFDKLEKLYISGCLMPGFFKDILSRPLTDSLRLLRIYKTQGSQVPSDEDNQAIAAARERSIQIEIYG